MNNQIVKRKKKLLLRSNFFENTFFRIVMWMPFCHPRPSSMITYREFAPLHPVSGEI